MEYRPTETVTEDKPRLLILYASQTGNALDAAERVGREAERRGCHAVVLSMEDFDASCLPSMDTVVFIVSTTGQGDTPDSMKVFWRFLLQKHLSQHWLKGVQYAVFGLGDSGYQKYNERRKSNMIAYSSLDYDNFVAKKLDKRLLDLGAKAIIEKGLGDDQLPSGYEGALDPWLSSLWNMLNQMNPMILPRCPEVIGPDTKMMDLPKFKIMYHDVDRMQSLFSTSSDLNDMKVRIESARSMSAGKIFHDKNRPHCFLQMIKNQQLTKEGCGKDVRHFEFEALSSDIQYEVGDFLEILPSQDPVAVDAFIQRCNLNPDSYITVLSFFATAEHEKERLQYFASPEGRDDLYQYNQKERRTVLEVLEDFPSVQMPFEWLVQLVPPLKTRAFSISSSLFVHPNQVHLTVDVVSWTTPYKRKRRGLCSNWLAGIDPQKRTQIPVWFHKGSLPSPSPSLPLILIGPGTGCAPFRAFVEERSMQSESEPTAPILFFFGCRNKENDFLYRDFWLSHARCDGVLSEDTGGGFFVAFSRDQPHKIYVQHKMREASDRIWSLLSSGAAIYVAGSANKMPADVLACVEEIVSTKSGLPEESAVRWVRALERAGRYHVEAWS